MAGDLQTSAPGSLSLTLPASSEMDIQPRGNLVTVRYHAPRSGTKWGVNAIFGALGLVWWVMVMLGVVQTRGGYWDPTSTLDVLIGVAMSGVYTAALVAGLCFWRSTTTVRLFADRLECERHYLFGALTRTLRIEGRPIMKMVASESGEDRSWHIWSDQTSKLEPLFVKLSEAEFDAVKAAARWVDEDLRTLP